MKVRLSITLETGPCVEALIDALARHGSPEIMNTDQGSQFTSGAFLTALQEAQVAMSMDGKGAFSLGRANAQPGLFQQAQAHPGGGITRAESHLSTARQLFKLVEPPLMILFLGCFNRGAPSLNWRVQVLCKRA